MRGVLIGNWWGTQHMCVGGWVREREKSGHCLFCPHVIFTWHTVVALITTANVTVAALVVPAVETASLKSNLKPLVGPVLSGVEVGEAENFDSPETV